MSRFTLPVEIECGVETCEPCQLASYGKCIAFGGFLDLRENNRYAPWVRLPECIAATAQHDLGKRVGTWVDEDDHSKGWDCPEGCELQNIIGASSVQNRRCSRCGAARPDEETAAEHLHPALEKHRGRINQNRAELGIAPLADHHPVADSEDADE